MKSSVSIATRTPARTATAFASLGLALAGPRSRWLLQRRHHLRRHQRSPLHRRLRHPEHARLRHHHSTAATGTILQFSTSASGAATPVSTIANLNVTSLGFLAVDGHRRHLHLRHRRHHRHLPPRVPRRLLQQRQPTRSIPFNTTTSLTAISRPRRRRHRRHLRLQHHRQRLRLQLHRHRLRRAHPHHQHHLRRRPASHRRRSLRQSLHRHRHPANNIAIAPIEVFAPSATAPIRTLSGALTTLAIGSPQGLATDSAGNLYVANVVSGVSSILIFEPTATGNTPPLRDITGSNTTLGCVGGIALDNEGYLYVVSVPTCGSTASPTVLKFSTTGDGNIAPVATFTSTAWTNADPTLSIAVY